MNLHVTPVYAGLLGLLLVALSAMVIMNRRRTRVSLGTGGDQALERAVRAQGNFVEYVPITLLLMLMAEWQGTAAWLLHVMGVALLAGRSAHAYGIHGAVLVARQAGMLLTFTVLVIASLAAIL
jgi:uncharacterized protein